MDWEDLGAWATNVVILVGLYFLLAVRRADG